MELYLALLYKYIYIFSRKNVFGGSLNFFGWLVVIVTVFAVGGDGGDDGVASIN